MTTRSLSPLVLLLGAGGLAIAGCTAAPQTAPTATVTVTATPTPVATQPALDDLILTPDGLTTTAGDPVITLGDPIAGPQDDRTSPVSFVPDACVDAGYAVGEPYAGVWYAAYPDAASPVFDQSAGQPPFFASVQDGVAGSPVRFISVSSGVTTDSGVGVGTSRADVEAAYGSSAQLLEGDISDTFVVEGDSGALVVEVTKQPADAAPYWDAEQADVVVFLRALSPELSREPGAGTDAFAPCPV